MNPETEQLLHSLGAITANEVPISLEEAAIAYLGERGERPTLLQSTMETEEAQ